jgi:hypothetical protein
LNSSAIDASSRSSQTRCSGPGGGFRISDGFISPLDLVAIGRVTAEEAKELDELETAGAADAAGAR